MHFLTRLVEAERGLLNFLLQHVEAFAHLAERGTSRSPISPTTSALTGNLPNRTVLAMRLAETADRARAAGIEISPGS